jgi:hypothetical protein
MATVQRSVGHLRPARLARAMQAAGCMVLHRPTPAAAWVDTLGTCMQGCNSEVGSGLGVGFRGEVGHGKHAADNHVPTWERSRCDRVAGIQNAAIAQSATHPQIFSPAQASTSHLCVQHRKGQGLQYHQKLMYLPVLVQCTVRGHFDRHHFASGAYYFI